MTLNSSYIILRDLHFHAFHGVMPQERITGNDYSVSVRIKYDVAKAMASDDVADTLNYAAVYDTVKEEMSKPSNLIEHLAGRTAHRLMEQFDGIEAIDTTITKTNPPMGADTAGAGIEIHVSR